MYAAEQRNTINVDGLASISHLAIHSMPMQERLFWLMGHALSGVVILLGGFHSLLSFIGSTGTIVAGNDTDAFSIVYARLFIIWTRQA